MKIFVLVCFLIFPEPKIGLKIAATRLSPWVDIEEIDGQPWLAGEFGQFLKLLLNAAKLNATLLVSKVEGSIGVPDEYDVYDGSIGMVQKNKCQILFVPLAYGTVTHGIIHGNSWFYEDGRFMTLKSPTKIQNLSLIRSFMVFDKLVTFIILLSFIVIVIMFTLIEWQNSNPICSRIIRWTGIIFRIGLNQGYLKLTTHAQKCFYVVFIMSFMMILYHLYGSFNTSLVVREKTNTIDTLEQLSKTNLRPVWLRSGPEIAHFRTGSRPMYKKIWDNAKRMGLSDSLVDVDPAKMMKLQPQFEAGKLALISVNTGMINNKRYMCSYYKKRKYYIAKETFASSVYGTIYSSNTSKEVQESFNNGVSLAFESGLLQRFHGSLPDLIMPMQEADRDCVENDDDWDESLENTNNFSVAFKNIFSLFIGFLVILSFTCLILLLEKLFFLHSVGVINKKVMRRRMPKNVIFVLRSQHKI